MDLRQTGSDYGWKRIRWILIGAMATLGGACGGVSEYPEFGACPEGQERVREDTILSFEKFRNGIEWLPSRPINMNGKIVIYQQYIFVIEPLDGIHVFDNTDKTAPEPIGFLVIPGNSDLFVRDDVLYADSYTDLVLIGVQNNEAAEIGRIPLAFEQAYGTNPEGIITETTYGCE